MRVGAGCHDPRIGICDPARIIFLLGNVVNDVFFGFFVVNVGYHRTDNVGLIVLTAIADIDVDNVVGVVNPKHGIGRVPVNQVNPVGA
jgi:hypothetical protein